VFLKAEKDDEIWLIGLKDSTELDTPLPSNVHLINAKTTPILFLFAPEDIRSFIYLYRYRFDLPIPAMKG
jgi:hypothetical protein